MFLLPAVFSDFVMQAVLYSSLIYTFGQHTPGQETDVNDLRGLHLAYSASVELPEKGIDTLHIGQYLLCGNTSDQEMRSYFLPNLLTEPYSSAINTRYPKLHITGQGYFSGTSAHAMELHLWGTRYRRDSVIIEESFLYRDEIIAITKAAVYKNEAWFIYPQKITREKNKED